MFPSEFVKIPNKKPPQEHIDTCRRLIVAANKALQDYSAPTKDGITTMVVFRSPKYEHLERIYLITRTDKDIDVTNGKGGLFIDGLNLENGKVTMHLEPIHLPVSEAFVDRKTITKTVPYTKEGLSRLAHEIKSGRHDTSEHYVKLLVDAFS